MPVRPSRPDLAVAAWTLILSASLLDLHAQGVDISGTVLDSLSGAPVANAVVAWEGVLRDTTDASGAFLLRADSVSAGPRMPAAPSAPRVELGESRITISGVLGERVSVRLFTIAGRCRVLVPEYTASSQDVNILLTGRAGLPPGACIVAILAGDRLTQAGCLVMHDRIAWRAGAVRTTGASPRGMAKAARIATLTATASGYYPRSITLTQDTVTGLVVRLAGLDDGVTVTEDSESVEFRVPALAGDTGTTYLWANNSVVQTYWNTSGADIRQTLRYNTVTLDNGLIRVVISPDLGMRILRVTDATRSPARQMFAQYVTPANPVRFAQNIGGIKPSFPYHENSTGMIDESGNLSYKAAYFIEDSGDAGVRVVMNMRFDYAQKQMDAGFLGKYGDCPLTCIVTVKPLCNDFSVRYVVDNPNPLRRGNRLWTDALYPALGRSDTWIFPTKFAIDHYCSNTLYDIQLNGIQRTNTGSFFALYTPYPFAGAYYATGDANHLRTTPDPVAFPGVKIYNKSPLELWGSTNCQFEAPEEKFTPAFEPYGMEHSYYMARGIGKVTYANRHIAIGTAGTQFKMTAPAPARVTVYNYNQSTNPIFADTAIGPTTVLTGTFAAGLRVVAGGSELCNIQLPLTYTDNSARFADLTASAGLSGCDGVGTYDARFGTHYELENVATNTSLLSSLAVLLAAQNVTASDDPDVLLSMANAAYRLGGFGEVDTILAAVGNQRPEQTRYLQALMALETGGAADFDATTIEGHYFEALAAVKGGDSLGAIAHLDTLLADRPRAIRPLLLRSWLTRDPADAMAAYRLNPGSIETWTVLRELGEAGAADILDKLLRQNVMASVRSSDFVKEITTGQWRHERRFEYDWTWFENIALPPFPDALKYDTLAP